MDKRYTVWMQCGRTPVQGAHPASVKIRSKFVQQVGVLDFLDVRGTCTHGPYTDCEIEIRLCCSDAKKLAVRKIGKERQK